MIRVGVCGLGMMGSTHLDIYARHDDVTIVAVADSDRRRLTGETRAKGNVEGQAQGEFDFASVQQFSNTEALIASDDVDVVDICLPTTQHHRFALDAIRAGKHVLVEKPVGRTAAQARDLVKAVAESASIVMPAMCMRFWPGWDWLKVAVEQKQFGAVLGATFRRVVSHPGGRYYLDGEQCGGALLDLHIHDTDFIYYCFGRPTAVTSTGYTHITGAIDHVVTQYHYRDIPLVMAEGGWAMNDGFAFSLRYEVNFERATATFDLAHETPLVLYEPSKRPAAVPIAAGMGYEFEIEYFLDCVRRNRAPTRMTVASAAEALVIFEAEQRSIETNTRVAVNDYPDVH